MRAKGQYRLAGDYAMNRRFERGAQCSRRVCGQTQRTTVAVEQPRNAACPAPCSKKRQPPLSTFLITPPPPMCRCRYAGRGAPGRDSTPKRSDGQRYTARLHGAARIGEGGGTPRSSSHHWLSFSSPSLDPPKARGRGRDAVGHLIGRACTHSAGARICLACVRV